MSWIDKLTVEDAVRATDNNYIQPDELLSWVEEVAIEKEGFDVGFELASKLEDEGTEAIVRYLCANGVHPLDVKERVHSIVEARNGG